MSSMVARLRAQIALEYTAATWGLHGIAEGTAKHRFITARLENIGACHAGLKEIIGEDLASRVMVGAMESSHDELQQVIQEFHAVPAYFERIAEAKSFPF